jgi:hypothetical protein
VLNRGGCEGGVVLRVATVALTVALLLGLADEG